MPNIALALKSEVSRIARKEARADTLALRKSVSTIRSDLAALKRRLLSAEKSARKAAPKRQVKVPEPTVDLPKGLRFSAKGLAAQRQRLGLSARECAALLGATAQSIYNWEEGKTRPLARHLASIAELRTLGVKSARARLEAMS